MMSFRRRVLLLSPAVFKNIRELSSTKNISNFNNFINADKFIIDRNPNAKREKFFEKEIAGKMMVCEKALPEDQQSIIDFYVTHFSNNEVLSATMKQSFDESIEQFADITNGSETLILRENEKFIGVNTIRKIELKELPKHRFQRMNDYGKIIDNGPFKFRTNNVIYTVLEASEVNLYNKMNFPCIYFHNLAGGLHPTCFGKNVGELLAKAALNYAYSQGAKYFIGVNTSDAGMKLEAKMPGMKFVEKFPYASFVDHGKKPFENVIGGNKYAYPFILDFEKDKTFYE